MGRTEARADLFRLCATWLVRMAYAIQTFLPSSTSASTCAAVIAPGQPA
jgi:hypothetical protein